MGREASKCLAPGDLSTWAGQEWATQERRNRGNGVVDSLSCGRVGVRGPGSQRSRETRGSLGYRTPSPRPSCEGRQRWQTKPALSGHAGVGQKRVPRPSISPITLSPIAAVTGYSPLGRLLCDSALRRTPTANNHGSAARRPLRTPQSRARSGHSLLRLLPTPDLGSAPTSRQPRFALLSRPLTWHAKCGEVGKDLAPRTATRAHHSMWQALSPQPLTVLAFVPGMSVNRTGCPADNFGNHETLIKGLGPRVQPEPLVHSSLPSEKRSIAVHPTVSHLPCYD